MQQGQIDQQDQQDQQQRNMDLRHLIRMRLQPQENVQRHIETLFRPIQKNQQQEIIRHQKEPIEVQIKDVVSSNKEQKIIEEKQELKIQTIEKIIQSYKKIIVHYEQKQQIQQFQPLTVPKQIIKMKSPKCKLVIVETKSIINIISSINKMLAFEDRLSNLALLMDPKCEQFKVHKNNTNLRRNISERINIQGNQNFRHEIMRQIHRIMVQRHRDQDHVRVRPLNVADMLQQLNEIPSIKVEKQSKQEIKDKFVEKKIVQEQNLIVSQNEIIMDQGRRAAEEARIAEQARIIAEQARIIAEQQARRVSQQTIPLNLVNQPMEEQKSSEKKQTTNKEQKLEIQQKQKIEISESEQEKKQLEKQQKIIEQKKEQQQQNQQVQKIQTKQNDLMIVQESIIDKNRQILNMLGLPQSFLRDSGMDAELFDQLPQDLQIDSLMAIMNQQRSQPRLQEQQQRQNENIEQGQQNRIIQRMSDPQSQNMAFVASLDQQLRAQILLQATPQFLMSLPPQMRAQAQNYRQRQVNQMIQEQELQEQQQFYKNPKSKDIKHPKLLQQQFPTIPQKVIKNCISGLLIKIPNFSFNSTYCLLLENKKTRNKMLTSILSLITAQKISQQVCQYNETTQKWTNQIQISKNKKLQLNLLQLIYKSIKLCPYQDDTYLMQYISYDSYFTQQTVLKLKINKQLNANEQNYCPFYYILDFALEKHQKLQIELIKRAKQLPLYLIEKIMNCMKKDTLPMQFFDHLHVFDTYQNKQQIQQLFLQKFPQQKPPKIEILAKILKYKFSQLSYLKKIHQIALKTYTPTYNEFLNQIYNIYNISNIKEIQNILIKYKNIHYQVIKYLYTKNRMIQHQPIGIILKIPHLLDFETKRFIFRKHPKIQKISRRRLQIEINRTNIFQQSYNQLMSKTIKQLQGRLMITFVDQPGYDAGGVAREWFLCLSREIFNPNYALFEPSSSGNTYQPNPKSYINPDHLNYFKFIGRFVAKALNENELIDAYFTRSFYKMILDQQLEFNDLQQQDYQFFKSMKWLKQNQIQQNIYTFSYLYDNFGKKQLKQLIPNGQNIQVNQLNKIEFIQKYCLSKMRDNFTLQINKFLQGFHQIIPPQCISFFQAKQLQLLMSGLPQINLEDLKKNVDYSGYTPTDQIIKWFWEIVQTYDQQNLARLIQFITGTSKIPMEGFKQLQGMNGPQKISIHRDQCMHQLPKAHTCFNQLDLPQYSTKAIMEEKLRVTLNWGSQGFGFM